MTEQEARATLAGQLMDQERTYPWEALPDHKWEAIKKAWGLEFVPELFPVVRSFHPNAYRCGDWAIIKGVGVVSGRPCYLLTFSDGSADQWPLADSSAAYQFAALSAFDLGEPLKP